MGRGFYVPFKKCKPVPSLSVGSDPFGRNFPLDPSTDQGSSKRRQLFTGEELNTV